MVLPVVPGSSLSVSQILTEYGIPASTVERISSDLFSFVGGRSETTCNLGATFSGKRAPYNGSAKIDSLANDQCNGLAKDSTGSIYVCGNYGSTSGPGGTATVTNFAVNPSGTAGTLPAAPSSNITGFVSKWNAAGTYLGSAIVSGIFSCTMNSVTCDAGNNVYVSGSYSLLNGSAGTPGRSATVTNFAVNPSGTAGTLPVPGGLSSGYFSKWNSAGTYLGSVTMETTGIDLVQSIWCDAGSTVYVCGNYGASGGNIRVFALSPSVSAGTLPVTRGLISGFISKWNPSCTYLGSATIDSTISDQCVWGACDSGSNVYACGFIGANVAGTVRNFGNPPSGTAGTIPAKAGGQAGLIAKWNSSGTYLGSAYIGGSAASQGLGVACDSGSNVYLVGSYISTTTANVTNFAPNPSGSAGTLPIPGSTTLTSGFISKWNSAGTYVASSTIVSTGSGVLNGVACDNGSNVYAGGSHNSAAGASVQDFATTPSGTFGTLRAATLNNGFVSKWNPSGLYINSALVEGTGVEDVNSLICEGTSNIYIGGRYGGTTGAAATLTNFARNPSGTASTLSAPITSNAAAFVTKYKLN